MDLPLLADSDVTGHAVGGVLGAVLGSGVGGAIAYLMLTRTIPALLTTFAAERTADRQLYKESLERLIESYERGQAAVMKEMSRLPCQLPSERYVRGEGPKPTPERIVADLAAPVRRHEPSADAK